MSQYDEGLTNFSGVKGRVYAEQYFIQIKVDDVNWKVLWKDKKNGAYWLEYFPQSEMQGGGPSEFKRLTDQEVVSEFGEILT